MRFRIIADTGGMDIFHMISDERILGGGDFTQSVLDEAKERLEERCRLQAQGYDLEKVTIRVPSELGIDPEQKAWRLAAIGEHFSKTWREDR